MIEEFKQRYLNQPYGDEWLLLRPLAYKAHPYRWATIGKEIKHIEDAQMDDVKSFFKRFYHPANAILVVTGNVKTEAVKMLAEKWFGPIPSGEKVQRNLPAEPKQNEARYETVYRDVPADSINKVYHMPGRMDKSYYAIDLLSDILGRGHSARLYQALVKDKPLFSEISAHLMGSFDPGLLVINGRLNEGVDHKMADHEIELVLAQLSKEVLPEQEVQKVKNKAESTHVFGELGIMNKAMNLAFAELLDEANMVNKVIDRIQAVTAADIHKAAKDILRPENCTTLYYLKKA